VQVNIKNLIDEVQCYQTVRELRWPNGVVCPSCESQEVIKRGVDERNQLVNAMHVTTVTHVLMI
jgi:transposase-like protein